MFNQDVIAAVCEAKFCRVVIYPAIRGWCGERVQLEVADEIDALGHTTRYHYTDPVSYSIQVLRLTPRQDEHQRLLRWHIEAPGLLEGAARHPSTGRGSVEVGHKTVTRIRAKAVLSSLPSMIQ